MGRPRKDPAELSERGSRARRAEVKAGKAEVLVVNRERPPQPPGLPARAATVWKTLLNDLEANGVLARSDALSIEGAARAVGRARECSSRAGTCKDERTAQAWMRLELQAWNTAKAYCDALGLSARARATLGFSVTKPQGRTPPAQAPDGTKASAAVPSAESGGAAPLPALSVIPGGRR